MEQNDYLIAFKQDTRVGPFYSKHRWVKGVDKNDAIANYKMKVFIDPCIYGEYDVLQVGLIKKEDIPVEEVTMKEAIVKGNRTKEKKPLGVVEYTAQFNIGVSDLECDAPYVLEMTNPDGSFERRVIVITTMSTQHINYTYWEEPGVRLKRGALLPSSFCGDNAYKLYKITAEDLK